MLHRRGTLTLGAAAALATAAASRAVVQAQTASSAPQEGSSALPYRAHTVRTPDGLSIAAYEYGNPEGPEIVFIHGFAQAALSWDRQTRDPELAREFRMVAYDLRGHGMSDKPVGDTWYKDGRAWADELKAVIEAVGMRRPVLVGWSYGGRIMGDYLTAHGHGGIAGMNWVCATSSTSHPGVLGPAARFLGVMGSPDPMTAIQATIRFLQECFEVQPDPDDFRTMLAFNMMAPRHVRVSLGGRQAHYEPQLRALDIPVLVTHGARDKVVDLRMGRFTAEATPGARLSVFEAAGHVPFWEDAPRFNRELAELVRSAGGRG